MAKVYVESRNGLLVGDALTTAARILVSIDPESSINFTSDAGGHYFEVSEEHVDAFMAQMDSEATPKKRGRKKAAAAVETAPEAAPAEPESDSDTQE